MHAQKALAPALASATARPPKLDAHGSAVSQGVQLDPACSCLHRGHTETSGYGRKLTIVSVPRARAQVALSPGDEAPAAPVAASAAETANRAAPASVAPLRQRIFTRRRRKQASTPRTRHPPPLAQIHILLCFRVYERVHHVLPDHLAAEKCSATPSERPEDAKQRRRARQGKGKEDAGERGDGHEADIPRQQHDGGHDVNLHVPQRVLQA
mmetsp:Transcript_9375/g.14915  ORF Transcript_9375/g.14915 Transcript_9375/m.14915 type:complete len:211 (-) Transcript_9375:109-741(-)